MITVRIGDAPARPLRAATDSWIAEQIGRRQRDDQPVCVIVDVEVPGLRIALGTRDCSSSRGGRPPNPQERKIIELWNDSVLNKQGLHPGLVIRFLRQLEGLLG